ncbi:MAG TPA: hypothetical protein DHV24_05195, partial [Candidatus Margulisbacteria bacterium]|nr:hypothetical protein [Candidatus Margulisiibacteriota bacterium]
MKDDEKAKKHWNEFEEIVNQRTAESQTALVQLQQEVADRKVIEEELCKSMIQYQAIFEAATDSFLIFDLDGNIVEVNPQACKMLGYSHEELIKLHGKDIVYSSDYHLFDKFIIDTVNYSGFNCEATDIRKDGTLIYVDVKGCLFDYKGKKHILAVVRDITEYKKFEEELIKANQQNTDILESITDAFFALDNQWKIIYINKTALRFNKKTKECIGRSYWDVFPSVVGTIFHTNYKKVMTEKVALHFEAEGIYVKRWVEVHVYPYRDGISVYFRDITERKQVVEALKNEQQRLFSLLDGLPAIVYLRDSAYNIFFSNQLFWNLFGKPRNKRCFEVIHNRKEPCEECPSDHIFNTKIPQTWERTYPNGKIFEVYTYPFQDINSSPLALNLLIDITGRKQFEKQMARLSKLNLIGEMAAGIAHEVRNPMTTVRGFLQLLGQKERYHQDKEHFNLMIEELDRANSIITEFLSLAKNKVVEFEVQNLNDILDSLFPLIQADAMVSDKYVILELNKIPDLLLDKKEIRQLFLNLSLNGLEAISSGEYMTISTYCES